MKLREDYLALRSRYQPAPVRLAIVAESPPASGKYFYDETGAVTEPLFSAMMKVMDLRPATKAAGLGAFAARGWILVDATYQPVNKGLSKRERDAVILRDVPQLLADLEGLAAGRPLPVVLVKANVCRLLEPALGAAGIATINAGRVVPFPSSGQQGRFHQIFGSLFSGAPVQPGPASAS